MNSGLSENFPLPATGSNIVVPLNSFQGRQDITSIEIPSSVTSIGSRAFSGCTGLVSVIIPDSVISIGDYAFSEYYAVDFHR